jgi:hypothetical protein
VFVITPVVLPLFRSAWRADLNVDDIEHNTNKGEIFQHVGPAGGTLFSQKYCLLALLGLLKLLLSMSLTCLNACAPSQTVLPLADLGGPARTIQKSSGTPQYRLN